MEGPLTTTIICGTSSPCPVLCKRYSLSWRLSESCCCKPLWPSFCVEHKRRRFEECSCCSIFFTVKVNRLFKNTIIMVNTTHVLHFTSFKTYILVYVWNRLKFKAFSWKSCGHHSLLLYGKEQLGHSAKFLFLCFRWVQNDMRVSKLFLCKVFL